MKMSPEEFEREKAARKENIRQSRARVERMKAELEESRRAVG